MTLRLLTRIGDHDTARTNSEQSKRYFDTSDDDKFPDNSISISDQYCLDIEAAKILAARYSPDKNI